LEFTALQRSIQELIANYPTPEMILDFLVMASVSDGIDQVTEGTMTNSTFNLSLNPDDHSGRPLARR
jgi:hypothetical protein